MAYLLNNKVSEKSTIKQALTRIFGVGPFLADSFCKKVGISPTLKLAIFPYSVVCCCFFVR